MDRKNPGEAIELVCSKKDFRDHECSENRFVHEECFDKWEQDAIKRLKSGQGLTFFWNNAMKTLLETVQN